MLWLLHCIDKKNERKEYVQSYIRCYILYKALCYVTDYQELIGIFTPFIRTAVYMYVDILKYIKIRGTGVIILRNQ